MSADKCVPSADFVIGQLRVLSDNGRVNVDEEKLTGAVFSNSVDWRVDNAEATAHIRRTLESAQRSQVCNEVAKGVWAYIDKSNIQNARQNKQRNRYRLPTLGFLLHNMQQIANGNPDRIVKLDHLTSQMMQKCPKWKVTEAEAKSYIKELLAVAEMQTLCHKGVETWKIGANKSRKSKTPFVTRNKEEPETHNLIEESKDKQQITKDKPVITETVEVVEAVPKSTGNPSVVQERGLAKSDKAPTREPKSTIPRLPTLGGVLHQLQQMSSQNNEAAISEDDLTVRMMDLCPKWKVTSDEAKAYLRQLLCIGEQQNLCYQMGDDSWKAGGRRTARQVKKKPVEPESEAAYKTVAQKTEPVEAESDESPATKVADEEPKKLEIRQYKRPQSDAKDSVGKRVRLEDQEMQAKVPVEKRSKEVDFDYPVQKREKIQKTRVLTEDEKKVLAHFKECPHVAQDSLMLYSDSSKTASRPGQATPKVSEGSKKRVEMSEDERRRVARVKELPHESQDSLMLYSDSSKPYTRPIETTTIEPEDSSSKIPERSAVVLQIEPERNVRVRHMKITEVAKPDPEPRNLKIIAVEPEEGTKAASISEKPTTKSSEEVVKVYTPPTVIHTPEVAPKPAAETSDEVVKVYTPPTVIHTSEVAPKPTTERSEAVVKVYTPPTLIHTAEVAPKSSKIEPYERPKWTEESAERVDEAAPKTYIVQKSRPSSTTVQEVRKVAPEEEARPVRMIVQEDDGKAKLWPGSVVVNVPPPTVVVIRDGCPTRVSRCDRWQMSTRRFESGSGDAVPRHVFGSTSASGCPCGFKGAPCCAFRRFPSCKTSSLLAGTPRPRQ